jgi:diguanylate cyclase (GGDEF)-like protein
MEFKLYLRLLQRSWWIVLLTMLTAAAAALLTAYFQTPIYAAAARFVISPNAAFLTGENNIIFSLQTLDRRTVITTYAEILNGPRLYDETLALLQLNKDDLINYSHSALILPDTNIMELSVSGTDPELVATIANSLGQRAIEYVEELYQIYDMTLLDSATIPLEPVSPQPVRDSSVAAVVGLALGVGLALARELLRTPIVNFMQQRKLDEVSLSLKREVFEERLEEVAFASAMDLSLCFVHLDGLTDYINVLPQPTLETILRHVNQVLRNQLRGNDLVGRWNDLDFSVLLSETSGAAALNTMGRVRSALSIPILIDITGDDLSLHPIIGIAEYRVGDNADSLVHNANWALDVAKSNDGIYLLPAKEPI